MSDWLPSLDDFAGPTYLRFAESVGKAVRTGELAPGTRLLPQRELAQRLNVDVTTVSRGMLEAQKRGLIITRGRAGSFVVVPNTRVAPVDSVTDLSINYPPPLADELQIELRDLFTDVTRSLGADVLLDYPRRGWHRQHSSAGAQWCEMLGFSVKEDSLTLAGGAQQALIGLLTVLCQPGDTIVTDGLTYPGLLTVARRMGIRIAGVDMDEEGIIPDALAETCRKVRPRVVYLVPTFQNPTAVTAGDARREKIAGVIEAADVQLLEDDGHGALRFPHMRPISALIPQRSYFVSSMSKCVSPGLRTAYVAAPTAVSANAVSNALITLGQFPAPLVAEVTARLVLSGRGAAFTHGMRGSAAQRWKIARAILPELSGGGADTNHYGWLSLPAGWRSEEFAERARQHGVLVAPAAAFAVATRYDVAGVRVCLGSTSEADLPRALETLALITKQDSTITRPYY